MKTMQIVVFDPKGEWWDGALVEEDRARQLQTRNVICMPVVPDLFKRSGVGGFFKRSWGAGWQIDGFSARTITPMTMYCVKDLTAIHWSARIQPSPAFLEAMEAGHMGNGFIRIVSDGSQSIPAKAGLLAEKYVDVRDLTKDRLVDGTFFIQGHAKVTIPGDGHYGFALYGFANGLSVLWSAISQASE